MIETVLNRDEWTAFCAHVLGGSTNAEHARVRLGPASVDVETYEGSLVSLSFGNKAINIFVPPLQILITPRRMVIIRRRLGGNRSERKYPDAEWTVIYDAQLEEPAQRIAKQLIEDYSTTTMVAEIPSLLQRFDESERRCLRLALALESKGVTDKEINALWEGKP